MAGSGLRARPLPAAEDGGLSMLDHLWLGLQHLLTIQNLLLVFAGTVAGMIAGALPGITATMAVAVLVPFTFTMTPIGGLVTLGAIYMGAIYGGSFSAILINTPGTPSSIGTTFDGYPMACQGRAEEAIVAATVGSCLGGLFGVVCLIFLSPPLADIALKFGPAEYFWVGVFGITIISSLSSGSVLKGLVGGSFGALISTIGIAPIGGDVRFTFGFPAMQGGVELIVALIGLFCIPELLSLVVKGEGMKTRSEYGYERTRVSCGRRRATSFCTCRETSCAPPSSGPSSASCRGPGGTSQTSLPTTRPSGRPRRRRNSARGLSTGSWQRRRPITPSSAGA